MHLGVLFSDGSYPLNPSQIAFQSVAPPLNEQYNQSLHNFTSNERPLILTFSNSGKKAAPMTRRAQFQHSCPAFCPVSPLAGPLRRTAFEPSFLTNYIKVFIAESNANLPQHQYGMHKLRHADGLFSRRRVNRGNDLSASFENECYRSLNRDSIHFPPFESISATLWKSIADTDYWILIKYFILHINIINKNIGL